MLSWCIFDCTSCCHFSVFDLLTTDLWNNQPCTGELEHFRFNATKMKLLYLKWTTSHVHVHQCSGPQLDKWNCCQKRGESRPAMILFSFYSLFQPFSERHTSTSLSPCSKSSVDRKFIKALVCMFFPDKKSTNCWHEWQQYWAVF